MSEKQKDRKWEIEGHKNINFYVSDSRRLEFKCSIFFYPFSDIMPEGVGLA